MVGSLFPALFEGLAEALEAPAEGRVLDERLLADGELEGSLERCARCERALKGGDDPETTFVSLVLYVCGRA